MQPKQFCVVRNTCVSCLFTSGAYQLPPQVDPAECEVDMISLQEFLTIVFATCTKSKPEDVAVHEEEIIECGVIIKQTIRGGSCLYFTASLRCTSQRCTTCLQSLALLHQPVCLPGTNQYHNCCQWATAGRLSTDIQHCDFLHPSIKQHQCSSSRCKSAGIYWIPSCYIENPVTPAFPPLLAVDETLSTETESCIILNPVWASEI